VNLFYVSDYEPQHFFADVVRQGRPWARAGSPREPAAVDADGWPTGDAGIVVFASQQGIAGDYQLAFTGKARVTANGGVAIRDLKHDPAGNRSTATLTIPDGGDSLFLSFRDTGAGVRDVSLIRPVEVAAGHFDKAFLDAVRPFRRLRFMDWQHTNGCKAATWQKRPTPASRRWAGDLGVPVEIQIACANAAKCDAWFCVPHLADDDYVRRMAQLVRDSLDPSLKAYVEFSNECWNGMFVQSRWCADQGKNAKLSDNDFQAQLRFYSQRSAAVATIWDDVFQGDRKRLVRVMASQSANPWVSEQVLGWQDAAKHTDVLAIAPYFGGGFGDPKRKDQVAKMSVDELLAAVEAEDLDKSLPETLHKQQAVARQHGVGLVCYEAGQHLVGHGGAENDEALTNLFIAANRHPRMESLYQKYITLWSGLDAGPMFLFSFSNRPSKWGSWGLVESLPADPARHPKLRAILPGLGRSNTGK